MRTTTREHRSRQPVQHSGGILDRGGGWQVFMAHAEGKEMEREATERLDYRRTEEAKRGVEILERIKVLGQTKK